jgi:probable F420-dependent oxidoreductase
VKFAISYSTAFLGLDPGKLLAYARRAEECGFEGFVLPEHGALSPGAAIGTMALPPELAFADPLECLSFVAAATDRILLGTAVLLLPLQHPVTLAKRLATIDVLAQGRLRLVSVGVGGIPGETAGVGVDFGTRGKRADEAIDVLRLLWSGDASGVSFHGRFFDFDSLVSFPQPVGGSMPIHIGGSSAAAARRAGSKGDGYFAGGALTPEERASQLALMRSTAAAAGREPETLEYTRWGSLEMDPGRVEAMAAQGVTRLVLAAGEDLDDLSAFATRHGLPDRARP